MSSARSILPLLLAAGLFLPPLFAAEPLETTAFAAIETARAILPLESSAQLVEVRGHFGRPGPARWTLLYRDPESPTGIRRVEVSAGRVVRNDWPRDADFGVRRGLPIVEGRLRVDSGAAYVTAAQRATAPYHTVSYLLRSEPGTRRPLWTLQLLDNAGAPLGMVEVDAASGASQWVRYTAAPYGEPVEEQEPLRFEQIRENARAARREVRDDMEDRFRIFGDQLQSLFTRRSQLEEE